MEPTAWARAGRTPRDPLSGRFRGPPPAQCGEGSPPAWAVGPGAGGSFTRVHMAGALVHGPRSPRLPGDGQAVASVCGPHLQRPSSAVAPRALGSWGSRARGRGWGSASGPGSGAGVGGRRQGRGRGSASGPGSGVSDCRAMLEVSWALSGGCPARPLCPLGTGVPAGAHVAVSPCGEPGDLAVRPRCFGARPRPLRLQTPVAVAGGSCPRACGAVCPVAGARSGWGVKAGFSHSSLPPPRAPRPSPSGAPAPGAASGSLGHTSHYSHTEHGP